MKFNIKTFIIAFIIGIIIHCFNQIIRLIKYVFKFLIKNILTIILISCSLLSTPFICAYVRGEMYKQEVVRQENLRILKEQQEIDRQRQEALNIALEKQRQESIRQESIRQEEINKRQESYRRYALLHNNERLQAIINANLYAKQVCEGQGYYDFHCSEDSLNSSARNVFVSAFSLYIQKWKQSVKERTGYIN